MIVSYQVPRSEEAWPWPAKAWPNGKILGICWAFCHIGYLTLGILSWHLCSNVMPITFRLKADAEYLTKLKSSRLIRNTNHKTSTLLSFHTNFWGKAIKLPLFVCPALVGMLLELFSRFSCLLKITITAENGIYLFLLTTAMGEISSNPLRVHLRTNQSR